MTQYKIQSSRIIKGKYLSRRQFLGFLGITGFCMPPLCGCGAQNLPVLEPEQLDNKETWTPFVQIEAAGSPFEIGQVVGEKTRDLIVKAIEDRRDWFEDLKQFALADRKVRIDGFKKAIAFHHPEVLAELKGLAKGADIPLDEILVLNFQPELGALKSQVEADACSTFNLVSDGQTLLVHNEDGHNAYHRRMIILKGAPKDAPRFTTLLYPGVLAGNVPFINDAGLLMSTNFIGAKDVKIGVPRYVLGRAVLSQHTIEQAIEVATNKDIAYSFHLNLGSVKEKRLVAVDVCTEATDTQETKGLFLQTNHFVLPGTKHLEQIVYKAGGSSDSRYQVLAEGTKTLPPVDQIEERHLIGLLSSHEAVTPPYSPCRHPDKRDMSRTLATAVFNLTQGTFHLYEGNPCKGRKREVDIT